MVRIRLPPPASQQRTRFGHCQIEAFWSEYVARTIVRPRWERSLPDEATAPDVAPISALPLAGRRAERYPRTRRAASLLSREATVLLTTPDRSTTPPTTSRSCSLTSTV